MNATRMAIGGLFAGLVLATLGLLQAQRGPDAVAESTAQTSTVSLDQNHGLAPIEDVIALWQGRSDEHPLDYLSRTQLGGALSTQARENADLNGYAAAESVLREALEINKSYEPAQLSLGSALHSQHRFVEANTIASEVIAASPSSLSARALLGDTYFELGDYGQAAENYEALAEVERSAPVVSRLARLASTTGQNEEAVSLANEALGLSERLALRPSAAAFYWFQLGHFQFEAGDVNGATSSLETALEIDPGNPGSSEALAFVAAATGNLDRAAQLYEALLVSGPAADIHGSYADVLTARGELDAAAEQNERGRALAEDTIGRFPAERRHLAGFFMTRDPALALRLAEADIDERQDAGAYDTLAWALYQNGRSDEAAAAIDEALAIGLRTPAVLYHAGAIAAANGDAPAAVDYLDEALRANPHFHLTEAVDAAALLDELE